MESSFQAKLSSDVGCAFGNPFTVPAVADDLETGNEFGRASSALAPRGTSGRFNSS
jgi:hypothetical protein